MAGRPRTPAPSGRHADGQHFLRSATLAAELVERSDISPDDVVVEIGGGTGRLTAPLAERAAHVIVIERDPALADFLRRRFASAVNVDVVRGNALDVALPSEPFRVFGNLPFAFGTRILRRILDERASNVTRLDALLQFEVARKRAQLVPGTLVTIGWLPWWEFTLVRRIHRSAFDPMPGVDAALLRVTSRPQPLLPAQARAPFVAFVARGFATPATPVAVTYRRRLGSTWKRFAAARGLPSDARAVDLDVTDWVSLFRSVSGVPVASTRRRR